MSFLHKTGVEAMADRINTRLRILSLNGLIEWTEAERIREGISSKIHQAYDLGVSKVPKLETPQDILGWHPESYIRTEYAKLEPEFSAIEAGLNAIDSGCLRQLRIMSGTKTGAAGDHQPVVTCSFCQTTFKGDGYNTTSGWSHWSWKADLPPVPHRAENRYVGPTVQFC